MMKMKIIHFKTLEDTLKYITKNPTFISGFTSGEGCFTAYISIMPKLTWGLQPCCEFSITQNSGDLILLESINEYFNTKGGRVYDKKDGVHVYMVRNLIEINNIILPFFFKYPLVGTKSYEFEKFSELVSLIISKKHIGQTNSNRNIFIDMALICKELNSKMVNPKKLARIDFIVNWLKSFNNCIPSMEDKLYLKSQVSLELKDLRKSQKIMTQNLKFK